MSKLLLIVIVVVVAAWWLLGRQRRQGLDAESRGERAEHRVEEMVECAHCGVHLPRVDAVLADGLAYCGNAHRAAGPRKR